MKLEDVLSLLELRGFVLSEDKEERSVYRSTHNPLVVTVLKRASTFSVEPRAYTVGFEGQNRHICRSLNALSWYLGQKPFFLKSVSMMSPPTTVQLYREDNGIKIQTGGVSYQVQGTGFFHESQTLLDLCYLYPHYFSVEEQPLSLSVCLSNGEVFLLENWQLDDPNGHTTYYIDHPQCQIQCGWPMLPHFYRMVVEWHPSPCHIGCCTDDGQKVLLESVHV